MRVQWCSVVAPGKSDMRVVLRPGAGAAAAMFVFGDVEVDTDRFEVRRGGEPVPVEPQVFELVLYLVTHRERVVTKAELLDNVWGDRFVSESALTSRIKAVRRAVGDDGRAQEIVRTVHGRGYRFAADVVDLGEPPGAKRVVGGVVPVDQLLPCALWGPARLRGVGPHCCCS